MEPHGRGQLNTDLTDIIERCKIKSEENQKNGVISFPKEAEDRPKSLLSYAGVDKKYITCTFESFHGAERLKEDLSRMANNGVSVLLTGGTGSGKTHLAVAMLAGYLKNHADALFITLPDMLLEIRSAFSDKSTTTEKGLVELYSSRQFMVLDDLGAEKPSEFTVSALSLILDRRIRQEKQTVITTNLSMEAIEEYSSSRIASRISEMEVIKVNMPDYRKKRGAK